MGDFEKHMDNDRDSFPRRLMSAVVQPEFSRVIFHPSHNYTGVLLEQGRALVDAEWNAQCAYINQQVRNSVHELAKGWEQWQPKAGISFNNKENCYQIELPPQVFFAQGVRIQVQTPLSCRFTSLPNDPIFSIHAWEAVTRVPTDPGFSDGESGLRTHIEYAIQIDAGPIAPLNYEDWIQTKRGRIRVQYKSTTTNGAPCLFLVQVTQASSPDTPPRFDVYKDGVLSKVSALDKTGVLKLNHALSIMIDRERPFRVGEVWAIAFRGDATEQFLRSQLERDDWMLPSGQHYYEQIVAYSENSIPDANPAQTPTPAPTPAPPLPGSSDSTSTAPLGQWQKAKMLPASSLFQAQSLHLKKWLGTALVMELDTASFDDFWSCVRLQIPPTASCDSSLCHESRQIWTAVKTLKESLIDNHHLASK